MDWQPIETAPRDGTKILAWDNVNITSVSWFLHYWSLVVCGSYAEDDEFSPTHWMPLPEPPPSIS